MQVKIMLLADFQKYMLTYFYWSAFACVSQLAYSYIWLRIFSVPVQLWAVENFLTAGKIGGKECKVCECLCCLFLPAQICRLIETM